MGHMPFCLPSSSDKHWHSQDIF